MIYNFDIDNYSTQLAWIMQLDVKSRERPSNMVQYLWGHSALLWTYIFARWQNISRG